MLGGKGLKEASDRALLTACSSWKMRFPSYLLVCVCETRSRKSVGQ